MQPTDRAAIPGDLDIAPSLVSYQYRNNQLVPVHISNVTTRTITVSPNAILCELQPVSVVDIYLPEDTSSDVLHNITLPTDLSDEQLGQGKRLLHQFRDVFSTSNTNIGHTTAGPRHIDFVENTPFKQRIDVFHRRCSTKSVIT